MRWHVIYEGQPRIEILDIYASDFVSAAEIMAKVHGLTGIFKVRKWQTHGCWWKAKIILVSEYKGTSLGEEK